MEILIKIPDDFPMQKVIYIGQRLKKIDALVADHPDQNAEVYFVERYLGIRRLEGVKTILLPDLNVLSLIVDAAKGQPLDDHGKNAAAILAFAQCLDILIDPAIALHEMASIVGNQAALEKLGWFRVADDGNPHEWIAAGLGEIDRIPTIGIPPTLKALDFAKPIKRWRRNYIVAMKMGELELNEQLNPIQKVTTLLEWMRDEFTLAGPAATLAFLYFAPNSPPKKGLLKDLRATDRNKALAGAKNAAWDITYLSEFTRRINESIDTQQTRHIFATFDERLRNLAHFVIGEHETIGANESLAKSFERWWPAKDAKKISDLWSNCLTRTRSSEWRDKYNGQSDYVGKLINHGEGIILSWKK